MTGYLTGEEFFFRDGAEIHRKCYQFDDYLQFKIEKDSYRTTHLCLDYNTEDNICCLTVEYCEKGTSKEHVLKCVGVNPIGMTTDEMDLEILRDQINGKINIVSICEDNSEIEWND